MLCKLYDCASVYDPDLVMSLSAGARCFVSLKSLLLIFSTTGNAQEPGNGRHLYWRVSKTTDSTAIVTKDKAPIVSRNSIDRHLRAKDQWCMTLGRWPVNRFPCTVSKLVKEEFSLLC